MMRRQTLAEIWPDSADRDAGVDALRAYAAAGEESPWPIRALVGFGAWIAALLIAVFAVIIADGEDGIGVIGFIFMVVGIALRRGAGPGSIFRSQFALSLSLAGHALLIGRLAMDDDTAAATLAVVLGAGMLWAFPDAVHRFLSTIIAVMGLAFLAFDATQAPWAIEVLAVGVAIALTAAFELEAEWQRSAQADLQLPVGFGLAAAFAILLLPSLAGELTESLIGGTAGLTAVLAFVVVRAARDAGAPVNLPPTDRRSAGLLLGLLLPVVVASQAPGIVGATLVLTLGLRRAHPVLFYGALLFAVVFIIGWYANMDLPLMQKAGALVGVGAGVLVLRAALIREEAS